MGFLTIMRKVGERIVIKTAQGQIEIMLFDAMNGRADIAIDAPREMKILRKELHILEEKRKKESFATTDLRQYMKPESGICATCKKTRSLCTHHNCADCSCAHYCWID